MRAAGAGVPLLVIRRTNAAAAASLCSTDASVPDGVANPRCQVAVPGPLAPPRATAELTGDQDSGSPAGATTGYRAARVIVARSC